jgi:hypothetical protein
MILQTLKRRHAIPEQQIDSAALDVAPQSVDREIFLVLEMIEKGTLGNACSLRDVLDRTSPKAEGMQRPNRAARQFFAQTWPGHRRSSGESFFEVS